MNVFKLFFVGVFLISAAFAAPPAHSQSTATNCTASQQSAVGCFVANAVTTHLATPRYGMTLAQFQSYGFAVSQILQTHQTYIVLVAISSAIADALPRPMPTARPIRPRKTMRSPKPSTQQRVGASQRHRGALLWLISNIFRWMSPVL